MNDSYLKMSCTAFFSSSIDKGGIDADDRKQVLSAVVVVVVSVDFDDKSIAIKEKKQTHLK